MLLVLGAAGGVGLAAVQIGKVCGAVVIAVARCIFFLSFFLLFPNSNYPSPVPTYFFLHYIVSSIALFIHVNTQVLLSISGELKRYSF